MKMVRHFRISSDWIKPSFSPLTNNKPRCTDWRAISTKLLLLRFANMSNTCVYFHVFLCATYRITCMIVGGVCEQVWLCILEWAVWSLGHLVVRRRRRRDKLVESTKSQGIPSNCHQFKLPPQNMIYGKCWGQVFPFLMDSDFSSSLFVFAAMPLDTLYWHKPICLFTLCFRKKVNSEEGFWHINTPQYSDNIPSKEFT